MGSSLLATMSFCKGKQMDNQQSNTNFSPDGKLLPSWRDANVPDGFTLVAVGDLVIDDVLSPRLKMESPELIDLLQSAHVTFGNFESTAIDLRKFGGYPEAESGGSWLISSPRVPQDLKAMGFNLLGRANNHTTDWGVKGMRQTDDLLEKAGIVHAGTGETLAEARAPRFLSTSAGRISLVSIASRFEAMSRATDPLGQIPGRPGVNALRTTRYVLVSPSQLEQLAAIRDAQPKGSVRASIMASDQKTGTVTLFGTQYRAKPDIGDSLEFTVSMHENDLMEILRNIRQGKQTSDFSVVTMHTHEPGNYSDVPPDFLPVLARQAIDNGADAFIGHGPHRLRGIEIYKKKPIFYSLGNFFFMENTQQPLTRDAFEKGHIDPYAMTEAEFLEYKRVKGVFGERVWYESVVTRNRYDKVGNLKEIFLYPIEMHWENARDADRGIPHIASPTASKRILDTLQRLSDPYGTKISVVNDIGVIRVSDD
ncbi:MAG TPA: CapA family protein [Noviherbaspirillum sp.]|uniref:CapA family protein n=1 Tax=Noviherbaspirillum sp. TaxID=1926288 RepID=UPI002DDD888E|nr:CapA family protein [Noviherbaspirillum sp.]HEV2608723.1 CapA family protein [Noviherbaspirillum sp.]